MQKSLISFSFEFRFKVIANVAEPQSFSGKYLVKKYDSPAPVAQSKYTLIIR